MEHEQLTLINCRNGLGVDGLLGADVVGIDMMVDLTTSDFVRSNTVDKGMVGGSMAGSSRVDDGADTNCLAGGMVIRGILCICHIVNLERLMGG